MKRKLTALLTAVLLAVTLIPMTAWAEIAEAVDAVFAVEAAEIAAVDAIEVTEVEEVAEITTEEGNPKNTATDSKGNLVGNGSTLPTFYVDDDWSEGNVPEGKTWGVDAFKTIQDAVNNANVSNGAVTINVSSGTYSETVRFTKYEWGKNPSDFPNPNHKYTDEDGKERYGGLHFVANGEVIMTGTFELGTGNYLGDWGDITFEGFTFKNKAIPIDFENSTTSIKDVVIKNNTFIAESSISSLGVIYIISADIEDVTISGNTMTGYANYGIDIGGIGSTLNNVTVTNNVFPETATFMGQILKGGVNFSGNTVNFLYWNNGKAPSTGKMTVSGNNFTNRNPILRFQNTTNTKKTDFFIGEGNKYKEAEIKGFAEYKPDTELSGILETKNAAVFYNGLLYFGDEPDAPPVAKIGETEYGTLAAAVAAAKVATSTEGKTITIIGTVDEAYAFAGDCSGITFLGSDTGKVTKGWTVQGSGTNMSNITIDGVKFCEGGNIVFSTAASNYSGLKIENCIFTGTGAANTPAIQLGTGTAPFNGIEIYKVLVS